MAMTATQMKAKMRFIGYGASQLAFAESVASAPFKARLSAANTRKKVLTE